LDGFLAKSVPDSRLLLKIFFHIFDARLNRRHGAVSSKSREESRGPTSRDPCTAIQFSGFMGKKGAC
jgi:hypothetical protein